MVVPPPRPDAGQLPENLFQLFSGVTPADLRQLVCDSYGAGIALHRQGNRAAGLRLIRLAIQQAADRSGESGADPDELINLIRREIDHTGVMQSGHKKWLQACPCSREITDLVR